MKKALAIAGILALFITPTASFADHLEPKESEIRRNGNLEHTNLRGQSLSGADLSSAYLSGAYMHSANLNGAYLRGADLRGADLTGANLKGADLTGADLAGAILTNADLSDTKLYVIKHGSGVLGVPEVVLHDDKLVVDAKDLLSRADASERSQILSDVDPADLAAAYQERAVALTCQ